MLEKVWTSKADFEGGALTNLWVPSGLNRLELKRLSNSGTGVWTFDAGAGKKFNWVSFGHTNPNQNIYYRDDFRDNSLAAWTIVGGTWQGTSYYMRGTANLDWQTNRVRVGPTSWAGLDILCKGYYSSTGAPGHRFYLRADSQGYNVNSYGFVLYNGGNVFAFRVANGSALDHIDKSVASPSNNTWYWFRIQIYTSGGNVIQRIKWWTGSEPGAWNVSHTWSGIWRSAGCFSLGRHSHTGENRYDDFLLSRKEGIPSPPNTSVSFKFWASSDGSTWGSEYTDITKVPNSRFIKIQATLSRTSLLSAMPTLEDMTLGYKLFLSQPIFI